MALPEVWDRHLRSYDKYDRRVGKDTPLLLYVKDKDLKLLIVDRMTSAQLSKKLNDFSNVSSGLAPNLISLFDATSEKSEVFLAMAKKINSQDIDHDLAESIAFRALSGYNSYRNPVFIHAIIDHVTDNWQPNHIKYFTDHFVKNAEYLVDIIGEDRVKKLIERTPQVDVLENPDWFKKLSSEDFKDSPVAHVVAQTIQDKISGALQDYTFSAPSVAFQEAASITARHKIVVESLESQLETVLRNADLADALDVGRSIVDDCSMLFNRIVSKNMEGLSSGLAARDAMSTVRKQLEILADLGKGDKTVDARDRNRLSKWIVSQNPFSSTVPAHQITNGYSEILEKIGTAEQASQDLIRGYQGLKKVVPAVIEALDHFETSLSGAVEKIQKELDGGDVSNDRQKNLGFVRDHFRQKVSEMRVNRALLSVHKDAVNDNTGIEASFVSALAAMRGATNVSMTNTAMLVSNAKEAATTGLKTQAALLFEQSAKAMSEKLVAVDVSLAAREAASIKYAQRITSVAIDAELVTSATVIKPPPAP